MEENSLAKAAERLFLSQSTVSYRLNELEKEIGTNLIYREQGKRTISLTSKGEDFIPLAERWVSLEKETIQWENKETSKSNFNIGSVDSLNNYFFHPLYKKIVQDDNSINLNISTHWSFTVYNLLKSYEIDIGFVLRYLNFNNIITKPLFRERMVIIGRKHNSSSNYFIRPSDLDPSKEIHVTLGSNLDQWRDYWFGQPLKSEFLVVDNAGLLSKILNNSDYWAVVPITVATDLKKTMDIKVSEIEGDRPIRMCYISKHKFPKLNKVNLIKIFEEYLQDFIMNNPNIESI